MLVWRQILPRHAAGSEKALTRQPSPMTDSGHLHWGAEALWQELGALLPGLSVEVVASADSTNTRLLERARWYVVFEPGGAEGR